MIISIHVLQEKCNLIFLNPILVQLIKLNLKVRKKRLVSRLVGIGMYCLLSPVSTLFAQNFTLKAWLYESDSFSKIPFAVVSLKNKFTATTSDESGYFEINCTKSDTLIVGHVGYQKRFIPVKKLCDSSTGKLKIYLKKKSVELIPVTISGKRLSDDKKEEINRHLNRSVPTISSPISLIYENFSRNGRERTKMDAIYSDLLLRDQIEIRLPSRKLYLITNDKSVKLDDLLMLCPVSSYFVLNASEYDFFYHFSQCWETFKRNSK